LSEERAEVSEEWLLVLLDVFEGLFQALRLHMLVQGVAY
jgi:hypothetical protein